MKRMTYIYALSLLVLILSVQPAFSSIKKTDAGKPAPEPPAPVHYVKVEGVVNPVMSEYLLKALSTAGREGAGVVVIELDTPGGLDTSMRDIIKEILSSEVPVAVYVGPSGARAASAGVFITYAAHVAAMAPGTNIGSAHPVAMGGEKMDETMTRKVENDAVAYIKSIAARRGRNAEWAEKAVRESVNITAEEALRLKVVDIVAGSRTELLEALDGRTVETVIGKKVINTRDALVKEVEMNWRSRLLKAIANPNVAYVLMMVGMMGIYFELSNPGAVLPGVVGAICLVLAFYSLHTLPVNYAGLILIGLAGIFFIAELQVVSYGLLTLAGIASLALGSLMLFDSPAPFMRVSMAVLLPTLIAAAVGSVAIMYFALRIHGRRPMGGEAGLIGCVGEAADGFGPGAGSRGRVFVEGEYWDAESDEPVEKGARVKVVEVKGLHIKVVRA